MAEAPNYAEGNNAGTPEAFTRREQLEQARQELNRERQVKITSAFAV
jgi:hypothetical protein